MASGGLMAVSDRALRHAIKGDEEMTACEVAWLDNGQLRNLIEGAKVLLKAAECELVGREAFPVVPRGEIDAEVAADVRRLAKGEGRRG